MKTPPWLLGATLLFWGWQTGTYVFGGLMALIMEAACLSKARWEFSDDDFNRVWNVCTVLFLGTAVYVFTANEGASAVTSFFQANSFAGRSQSLNQAARAVLVFIQWLPLVFVPLVVAQALSNRESIGLSTFSWVLRRKKAKAKLAGRDPRPEREINVAYPYFAVLVVASSATQSRSIWFFAGLSLLVSWALWPDRSRRYPLPTWIALMSLAIALGYLGQMGLRQLQKIVDNVHADWLTGFSKKGFDAKESQTRIGQIGRLKLSGKIVLRVESRGLERVPPLLREASYSLYKSPGWYGTKMPFNATVAETNETTWLLLPGRSPERAVTVSAYMKGGRRILPLPLGVSRVENLPVLQMETNRLGTVRVSDGPGLIQYEAGYGRNASIDSPPDADDLALPPAEEPVLSRIVSDLRLPGQSPGQILKSIEAFFRRNFQYSTYLEAGGHGQTNRTPLASFLLETRAGHCEFFATATVLLLRKAGIPARYAVGYSVQEPAGKKYIVRDRHAHAWCLVHEGGAWQDFDTTPGTWLQAEEKNASFWEPISDALSGLWFEFSKWRWSKTGFRKYLLWLVAPVLIALVGRLFWKRQWTRLRPEKKPDVSWPTWPGLDSEFYLIEQRLSEQGIARHPGEPFSRWLRRAEAAPGRETLLKPLDSLLLLHYRYRFDPAGLGPQDREALRSQVQSWLERGA